MFLVKIEYFKSHYIHSSTLLVVQNIVMPFIAQSSACCSLGQGLIGAACSECCSAADRAGWFKTSSTRRAGATAGRCSPLQTQVCSQQKCDGAYQVFRESCKTLARLRDGPRVAVEEYFSAGCETGGMSHFSAWEVSSQM